MKIIDIHCHLTSEILLNNLRPVLERAQTAGVAKIINTACNLQTARLVLEQLKEFEMLYGAVGIQPHDVSEYTTDAVEQIKNLAQQSARVVAIGEIGLDAYRQAERDSLHIQKNCFEHFLSVACELNLPVVVHVRDTVKDTLSFISKYAKQGLRGVIHCFTGTEEEARQFLDCGFYLSFAGVVTFKNAQNIANVAGYVPLDKILIETDSPYLAPLPFRGKTNEPSFLPHICEFIAKKRNLSVEEFAHQTYLNSHTLFNKL